MTGVDRPDPAADLGRSRPPEGSPSVGTFEVVAQDPGSPARSGRLWTAHGPVETPAFMPVGTYGAVKGLVPSELERIGSQVVLANAYHLTHRPGADRIAAAGGLHRFMGWNRAILTDSGGYQIFSLRSLQRIDAGGVDYRTHFDGSGHRMTPQSVLEVQAALGSDICMILDHCPPGDASPGDIREAMERSTRWAEAAATLRGKILGVEQLCFGIVQGGIDLELRRRHLAQLAGFGFDGLAIGGLSVGEPIASMHDTISAIVPEMPRDRPRYVMGIGTPRDLLVAVCAGVDMFDCVIPTRHARNGQVFSFEGKLNLRRSEYRGDDRPIDANCDCSVCTTFSRAYLRHLHEQNDPLYVRLATLHNVYFFHQWVAILRRGLRDGRFSEVVSTLDGVLQTAFPAAPGQADPPETAAPTRP